MTSTLLQIYSTAPPDRGAKTSGVQQRLNLFPQVASYPGEISAMCPGRNPYVHDLEDSGCIDLKELQKGRVLVGRLHTFLKRPHVSGRMLRPSSGHRARRVPSQGRHMTGLRVSGAGEPVHCHHMLQVAHLRIQPSNMLDTGYLPSSPMLDFGAHQTNRRKRGQASKGVTRCGLAVLAGRSHSKTFFTPASMHYTFASGKQMGVLY
jgi:hypothetical protein